MAENFVSSKGTKKRKKNRLATEDFDNILKVAEAKKICLPILTYNINHLLLLNGNTLVNLNDQEQLNLFSNSLGIRLPIHLLEKG